MWLDLEIAEGPEAIDGGRDAGGETSCERRLPGAGRPDEQKDPVEEHEGAARPWPEREVEHALGEKLQAQATWDAAFGWSAVRAAKASDDPKAIVVVLLGEGHVYYGLGTERQALLWFDGKDRDVRAGRDLEQRERQVLDRGRAGLARQLRVGRCRGGRGALPDAGFATRFVQADNEAAVLRWTRSRPRRRPV